MPKSGCLGWKFVSAGPTVGEQGIYVGRIPSNTHHASLWTRLWAGRSSHARYDHADSLSPKPRFSRPDRTAPHSIRDGGGCDDAPGYQRHWILSGRCGGDAEVLGEDGHRFDRLREWVGRSPANFSLARDWHRIGEWNSRTASPPRADRGGFCRNLQRFVVGRAHSRGIARASDGYHPYSWDLLRRSFRRLAGFDDAHSSQGLHPPKARADSASYWNEGKVSRDFLPRPLHARQCPDGARSFPGNPAHGFDPTRYTKFVTHRQDLARVSWQFGGFCSPKQASAQRLYNLTTVRAGASSAYRKRFFRKKSTFAGRSARRRIR
jgi:hypothetical protein